MRKPRKPFSQRLFSAEDRREIAERAKEWKEFRRTYLFSQAHLAEALGVCRRTIAAVESGREVARPTVEVLRRFRALKRRMARVYGPIAPIRNHDDEHSRLLEKRA